MNKKTILGILALIVISVIFINYKHAWNALENEQQNSCAFAPAEYKSNCEQTNIWLDQKLVEWKSGEYKPMKFNGHLLFASEEMIDITNSEVDAQFLELMKELDTDTISLFIYPDMFEKNKARYENMINKIRAAKKKLYIAYMVGGGSKFVKFSNFEEYRKTELDFTKMFIENYHPDYYVVIDEPTTMERRTGLNVSDEGWGVLVLETVNLIKSIDPERTTVATGHSQELGFLKALTAIKNLDMIGLNIWGIDQIDETTKIGKNIKDTVIYAKTKGKGVVFEQTWVLLHDAPEAKKLSVLAVMKEPDAKYIKVLTYYANQNNVDIYSPFYIGKFVEFNVDPVKFKSALDSGQRTPAFYSYKSVIDEVRNNAK